MDSSTPGVHRVRFRCPGEPGMPTIISHPDGCDVDGGNCPVVAKLADRVADGRLPWVDGEYWVQLEPVTSDGGDSVGTSWVAQRCAWQPGDHRP